MPLGKAAGVRCAQLTVEYRCAVFGLAERPGFCGGLRPSAEMCGTSREHAVAWLAQLERLTEPGVPRAVAGLNGVACGLQG